MSRKIISWGITIGFALVVTGFILTHGLSGSLHTWMQWSKDVYNYVSGHAPVVKGPVHLPPPNFHVPSGV